MKISNEQLSRVAELQSHLETKLTESHRTKTLAEITERIGSLAKPSKMPGYSWSIPATYCITGSLLHQRKDTPCSKCYALKGRYLFSNVKEAQEKRLHGWNTDKDWIPLMSIRLLLLGNQHFRWFDSGDLQSVQMLRDINGVAINTKGFVNHWLPTQERKFVKEVYNISSNLTIRLSSPKLNVPINSTTSSFITNLNVDIDEDIHLCPSSLQNGKCLDCRACWDPKTKTVAYILH